MLLKYYIPRVKVGKILGGHYKWCKKDDAHKMDLPLSIFLSSN